MTSESIQGCWIDVFELSHYRGKRRRLFGPSAYPSIRSRVEVWGIIIDSIVVGPQAYVRLFSQADPDKPSLWLLPRQSVGDVVDLRINDAIDSIEIFQKPPAQSERGYDAYMAVLKTAVEKKN